jgi:inhibitor of KinA
MEKSYKIVQPDLLEIKWPQNISDEILNEQLAWKYYLLKKFESQIYEIRMGFNTLSILFSKPISEIDFNSIWSKLQQLPIIKSNFERRTWLIPVCYEDEYGIDLNKFAAEKHLTKAEVIALHSEKAYRFHFYGFLPGFMYLGGLDPRLHHPRKNQPDLHIPAGSVAIGGQQTGIYPIESPGGWYLIGRTPIKIFDYNQDPPVLPQQGDYIRFVAIDATEFQAIDTAVSQNQYFLGHA